MLKVGSRERTAVGFIRNRILHRATSHRAKHPGAPVVLAGDLNADIQALQE